MMQAIPGQMSGGPMLNYMSSSMPHPSMHNPLHTLQQSNMIISSNQQIQLQAPVPNEQIDPITKIKTLLNQLKEILYRVLNDASQNFNQNLQIENGSKSHDSSGSKNEVQLEKLFNICDQIEINLRLSIEVLQCNSETRKYVPFHVHEVPSSNNDSLPYQQFVTMVKNHLTCAKDIHDLLVGCSKKIFDNHQSHQ